MLLTVHKTATVGGTVQGMTCASVTMMMCGDIGLESIAVPVRKDGVHQTALDDSVSRAAAMVVGAVSLGKENVVASAVTMVALALILFAVEDAVLDSVLMSILVGAMLDFRAQTVRSVRRDSTDPIARRSVQIVVSEGLVTVEKLETDSAAATLDGVGHYVRRKPCHTQLKLPTFLLVSPQRSLPVPRSLRWGEIISSLLCVTMKEEIPVPLGVLTIKYPSPTMMEVPLPI